ncbi:unnamed protein product [Arabis nemorensis]|uniref:Nop domain-containing protein n=1 Tax=Arabis nemorensis TaxID=586526 RepID=A0A565BHD0_9BRAS|nr:unnamed protein product [Arabis nemorensis]
MSYIPPHKRHSKDPVIPSPVPDYLVTKFKKNLNFKRSRITYSEDSISKWFIFSSNGIEDEVPPSVQLVPVSSNSAVFGYGTKPSVLMNNNVRKANMITEGSEEEERTRWLLVAEKVEEDLVLAYERAKKKMESHHLLDTAKLRLVARFGKNFSHGRPYSQIYLYKIFTTDVPTSFIQNIKSKAIPSHKFCIDMEKETYIVKVSHYTRPNATIRCKCIMKEDGRLSMYKASLEYILFFDTSHFAYVSIRNGTVQRLAFSRFKNANRHDEEINMLGDRRLSPHLRFLKYYFDSEVESLAVGDARLGNEINVRLGIQCAKRKSAIKLLITGRIHFGEDVTPLISLIGSLDALDPQVNQTGMSLKDFFGPKFARVGYDSTRRYSVCKVCYLDGKQNRCCRSRLPLRFLTQEVEADLKEVTIASIEVDFYDNDVAASKELCAEYLSTLKIRDDIQQAFTSRMNVVVPHLTGLLGERLAARLIAQVGSLPKLVNLPGSKVQYLVFTRNKPKVARSLATKICLAARCNLFGRGGQVNHVATTGRQSITHRITTLEGSGMSYIPPHKRNSKDPNTPSPVPDSLVTKFKKNLNLNSNSDKLNRIVYSGDSIWKWFLIGANGIEDEIPPSVTLVPLSSDSVECRNGEKPSILMNNNVQKANMSIGESEEDERTQWMLLVAEKVEEDLVLAYERAKTSMDEESHSVLRLVASFGKNLFYVRQAGPLKECSRKNMNKVFDADVPTSYIQHIKSKVVPSHEFCIEKEKETYIVKVSHYTRPNETIQCKCILKEDGQLSMYKVELNLVRHLVVDVSCIDKNLDMRLMLTAKRKMTTLTEKEISNIKGLLDPATVDPNVKGGLRWPLGKSSSGDGYKVFETCHVKSTVYKNQTLRLRVRKTDRFNERIGTGEIKREVALMLKDINTKLQEQNIERGCAMEMLKDALGTLWDFLHCDAYLT